MTERDIWILGAGGHAKVAAGAALTCGWTVTAVYADEAEPGSLLLGAFVRVPIPLEPPNVAAHIAIGANRARAELSRARLGWRWVTLVHPRAWIDPGARIGAGSLVCAGACVQIDAVVGGHAILNTGCNVDHDCRVGDFAHIAPGVALCGAVTVEEGAFVGVGASVAPGVTIGAWAVVGAGAVVIRDVPPGVTVVGNPARVLVAKR